MEATTPLLLLADHVPASLRAHSRGVHRSGRNIEPLAHPVRVRLTVHRDGNLALKDNMRGHDSMLVIGIVRVRAIPPNVRVSETFRLKL